MLGYDGGRGIGGQLEERRGDAEQRKPNDQTFARCGGRDGEKPRLAKRFHGQGTQAGRQLRRGLRSAPRPARDQHPPGSEQIVEGRRIAVSDGLALA